MHYKEYSRHLLVVNVLPPRFLAFLGESFRNEVLHVSRRPLCPTLGPDPLRLPAHGGHGQDDGVADIAYIKAWS